MLGIDLRSLLVYDACSHWRKQFTASSSSPHSHIWELSSNSVRKNMHCAAADIVARGCRILLTELATRGLQHICTLKIRCNASFHSLFLFFFHRWTKGRGSLGPPSPKEWCITLPLSLSGTSIVHYIHHFYSTSGYASPPSQWESEVHSWRTPAPETIYMERKRD